MNETTWLPIQYREFYDVPRSIVVEYEGALYLFESALDDALDDYSEVYQVYRLPIVLRDQLNTWDTRSWIDLALAGIHIGEVPVASVELDETKRAFLKASTFQRLEL